MINKKRVWLGLVASLGISPVLVATYSLPSAFTAEPQQAVLQPPAAVNLPDRSVNSDAMRQLGPLNAAPTSDPFQVGPPEKFIAAPGKTPPFLLTGQPIIPKGQSGTEPAAQPAPVPTETPPKDIPPKGSAAPGAQSNTNNNAPTSSPSVAGDATLNSGNVGDLLAKSNNALGVEVQKRSPVVGDPRVEGLHFGQLMTNADGGYWFPARVDLDTVVSKINASDIDNILVIRGPFSVRYGPGFSFLDIQSLGTPRYADGCFQAHGSSTLNYRTNGQGWQGQQSFWGGSADWGFRISYDLQTAIDYTTGNGTRLPSGYNNQVINFAYGFNLTPDSSLELKYLHAQQSNVVFPGLLTNINELVSDGFTARYSSVKGTWYDRFTLDAWVNSTRFNGDSSNPGTRQQIPQLNNIFPSDLNAGNAALNNLFFPVRLDLTTNGNALSYGAREITTWGEAKGFNVSLGADIRVFSSNYNEYDAFNLSVAPNSALPVNFGIPYGRQIDPGLLLDMSIPIGERMVVKAGTRVDFVTNQFLGFGPNMNVITPSTPNGTYIDSPVGDPNGNKSYLLFAAFLTGEYKITQEWTAQAGYGYAERPPTLTELYSGGAFLGLIQNGFNSIYGDPNLRKEAMHQINLGLTANYEKVRAGVNAFYAFMPNYITYRGFQPPDDFFTVDIQTGGGRTAQGVPIPTTLTGTTPLRNLQFANTRLATMFGFDAYTEVDATPYVTPFFTLNFTEGWDHTIDEALPGISPLSSKVGVRFHDAGKDPKWGVEYFARMVATQDLFAASLGEQRTGGFVTHNLRAYWQARESVLLLAGVENIGNLQYREHLDLRTGTPVGSGVFQPGINFYFGAKLTY